MGTDSTSNDFIPEVFNNEVENESLSPEGFIIWSVNLTDDSMAIDFSDPLYAPAEDIDSNVRDAYPDAGCY